MLVLLGQLGVFYDVHCGLANHVLRMLGAPDPRRLEGVQGGSGCRNGVEAYRKPFPPEDATSPPALLRSPTIALGRQPPGTGRRP